MKHNQISQPGFYWLKQPKHDPLVPNPYVAHVEEWYKPVAEGADVDPSASRFVYIPYLEFEFQPLKHAGPDAEWFGPLTPPTAAR